MSKDPPINGKPWKGHSSSIAWSSAGKDSLHSLVSAITNSGNAVMFSRTIDGSALIFSVYAGNEKAKEFITEAGDIPALFAWAIEQYT